VSKGTPTSKKNQHRSNLLQGGSGTRRHKTRITRSMG